MLKSPEGFFFDLIPDRVLDAVEAAGLRCTGRCSALNSFENRVYDVELEAEEGPEQPAHSPTLASHRRIVKFYRPGRWTTEQILEEHEFLLDLEKAEIPVIAPICFPDGHTLQTTAIGNIHYALFPRVGGRAPSELTDEQLIRVGRLLGRIHAQGAAKKSQHRMRLDPQAYGLTNLTYLLNHNWIPKEFENRYEIVVKEICKQSAPRFETASYQRIHGDCHFGNLLWNNQGPFFLDFDDMVCGPAVQDVWLLAPGRDLEGIQQRETLLEGYREMNSFETPQLHLIEPLRALRMIHYTTWIARRWDDPAFPHAFPDFGTHHYWSNATLDLEQQLRFISLKPVTEFG